MHLEKVTLYRDHFPTDRYHPFNIPALRGTPEISFRRPVTFFVGENGSGKSTLLEAIARRCGIPLWDRPKRHIVHDNPYEGHLADFCAVRWRRDRVPGSLFRAENYREFADFIDDVALCDPGQLDYYGGHLLNTLSHGEGILGYFAGRCRRRGLYLLDEPESALSPANQVAFVRLLRELELLGDIQFLIATHSPILLAHPGAQIYSFGADRIREVNYKQTAHYQIYAQFLSDPEAFLARDTEPTVEPACPEPVYAT
jgi:predicted ATPase